MKTLTELKNLTKEERFLDIFTFVTTGLKNSTSVDIIKKALRGFQDEEVLNWNEAFIISELSCKCDISVSQIECLVGMCKVNQ
jgi:hypothetical protein